MKQKLIINVIIVLVVSGLLLILWFHGLAWIYAELLRLGASFVLLFSSDTEISLKMVDGAPTFIVDTLINGRRGTYPQKADLILLPFIMIITWQVFLFFNLSSRDATRSAMENILIFYLIQVVYVLMLTGYHNSSTIKFIYNLLLDSFYIIALFLIVKDAFKHELIGARRRG